MYLHPRHQGVTCKCEGGIADELLRRVFSYRPMSLSIHYRAINRLHTSDSIFISSEIGSPNTLCFSWDFMHSAENYPVYSLHLGSRIQVMIHMLVNHHGLRTKQMLCYVRLNVHLLQHFEFRIGILVPIRRHRNISILFVSIYYYKKKYCYAQELI